MKIRNGFVSNSSTSSFLIIGYDVSDLNIEDVPRKIHDASLMVGEDYGLKSDQSILGISYIWEYDGGHTDMADIYKRLEEVKEFFGLDKRPIKLFWGTIYG